MAEHIDPWDAGEVGDYARLMKEFGIEPMLPYKKNFPDNAYIRRGIIFGHRGFKKIAESIAGSKPYAMMTGMMPSGRFHFGHKMVADQIIWHQSKGARIYVCAADMESWLMRDTPLENARKIALDEYLENYLALGLKPEGVTFWFQSDYRSEYYRLRDMASKRVTLNELKAIYGELTPGKMMSVLTQVADILHPQLKALEGPTPTVVPVGVDQDPHIRLTRDIAYRMNSERDDGNRDLECIQPSATYHAFMSGLQGGKMSSSSPRSFIALTDDPKEARKKIMSAKTGGRATVEEQRKLGGSPSECGVYELYLYHIVGDDSELGEIHSQCKSGRLTCGDCKKKCAELLEAFLAAHQKRKAMIKKEKQVDKLLRKKRAF